MQYTLARRIPTHPTFPAFLKYLPSVEIRKLVCVAGWASQVAKIILATQTISHPPAGSVDAVHTRAYTGIKKCP